MSILLDDDGDGQPRVDRMIDEFRQAQSRRQARAAMVKRNLDVMEAPPDAHPQAAVAVAIPTPASHEND